MCTFCNWVNFWEWEWSLDIAVHTLMLLPFFFPFPFLLRHSVIFIQWKENVTAVGLPLSPPPLAVPFRGGCGGSRIFCLHLNLWFTSTIWRHLLLHWIHAYPLGSSSRPTIETLNSACSRQHFVRFPWSCVRGQIQICKHTHTHTLWDQSL